MEESEKFRAVIEKLIEVNPDADTCREILTAINKHLEWKTMMHEATKDLYYSSMPLNGEGLS